MDVRYCYICNKEIVKVCLDEYVYKKRCGNKVFYACSWTCYNKVKFPSKRVEREANIIEQELNGDLPISEDHARQRVMTHKEIREEAKESKEIAERRREIERGLKRRGRVACYWDCNSSTHNNSKTT
jgi:uncharacterized protein YktB (UPF0637 family)